MLDGTFKGYHPIEALWRLMQIKGCHTSFQAFQEAYQHLDSLDAMTVPLEKAGFQVRLALIQSDELTYLELPTLLQLQDGNWVILKNRKGRQLFVEGPDGPRQIPLGTAAPLLSGQVLDLSPGLPDGEHLWQRYKKLLSDQKKILAKIALATLMLQLLALAMPELTAIVMNKALPDGAGSTLKLAALGVMLMAVFQTWTGWLRERAILYFATRLEVSSERGFLEHLLRLPFPTLQKKPLGDLIQAFSALVNSRELLTEHLLGAFLDGFLAVLYLAVMAWKLAAPTAFVLLIALFMVTIALLAGRSQARQQSLEVEAQAQEQGYLTELIAGIGTIKAAGAEKQGLYRWLQRFQKKLGYTLKKSRLGLWTEIGLTTLQQTTNAVLIIWGGHLVLKGQLDIGTLFAYLQLSTGFLSAVAGLAGVYGLLVILRPQLSKAKEVFEAVPEERQNDLASPSSTLDGPVIMEDLWFRYSPETPWILKGYNLHVDPGEKFVLTGPSGTGKSTLLRLLSGLYVPEKGHISIAGLSAKAARRKIYYLPQFVQIYGASVMDNLRTLAGVSSMDAIISAAQRTGLHDLVGTFPMGYNTLLPNGGKTLSGGQRQLIAITAAMAAGRPLLLLDESTANVDAVTSLAINKLIHEGPWTLIATAHQ